MKKLLVISIFILPSLSLANKDLDDINRFNDSQIEKREIFIKDRCGNIKDVFKKFDCTNKNRPESLSKYPTRGQKEYIINEYYGLSSEELIKIKNNLVMKKINIDIERKPTDINRYEVLDQLEYEIFFIDNELL